MKSKGDHINEKDLSALKQIPQKYPRLSEPHGYQKRSQGISPSQSQGKKIALRINHDPLDQSPSGVCGVFLRGKSETNPIFLRACLAGSPGTGIGHHDQQKSVECGIPEPAQTPYESMVSGAPAYPGPYLQDEFHRQARSCGSFLAGTL